MNNEIERLLVEFQTEVAKWQDALRHHRHPEYGASKIIQKPIEARLAAISEELCEICNVKI